MNSGWILTPVVSQLGAVGDYVTGSQVLYMGDCGAGAKAAEKGLQCVAIEWCNLLNELIHIG